MLCGFFTILSPVFHHVKIVGGTLQDKALQPKGCNGYATPSGAGRSRVLYFGSKNFVLQAKRTARILIYGFTMRIYVLSILLATIFNKEVIFYA